MSKPIQYSLTNDTVTVFIAGSPQSVTKGAPNYASLRKAVLDEDWDAVPGCLTVDAAVETWAAQATTSVATVQTAPAPEVKAPTVTVKDDQVFYNGEPMPKELNARILKMVAKGEKAEGLIAFWHRLKRNPNKRSIDQLWNFLSHCGIPIQDDGTFLAYKGVRNDFRDAHSGQYDNSPGKTIRMDRNKISTDPAQTCHTGLHVGALSYARSFATRTLIVRVDPEHVCCVPNDYSATKMRVCEYTVMGLYGGQMPDTSFKADAPVETETVTPITTGDAAPTKLPTETVPLTGTPWDDFNPMSAQKLAEQSLDDLRKYARYNCLISGASKLPGGKDALVAKILEARSGQVTAPEPVEVPKPVEETKPAPAAQKGTTIPLTGTEWDHLNGMDSFQLMEQGIDVVRKYATYNCLIVGASKMPGGKMALVTRICEVRGDAS